MFFRTKARFSIFCQHTTFRVASIFQKLKVGDTFKLDYFLEDGVHTLGITYSGKDKIETDLGTFNCLKFNPTIIPGRVFRKDSKLYLWITDDDNRIPLRAHVELVVGSVTMDLTSVKDLKCPLKPVSKVNWDS